MPSILPLARQLASFLAPSPSVARKPYRKPHAPAATICFWHRQDGETASSTDTRNRASMPPRTVLGSSSWTTLTMPCSFFLNSFLQPLVATSAASALAAASLSETALASSIQMWRGMASPTSLRVLPWLVALSVPGAARTWPSSRRSWPTGAAALWRRAGTARWPGA
ncbi:Os12g0453800 [Oryza sativa Japonica Group]|uniref:Os12g0453800 protein n=1 Tax=Oryza sativa subsp. japonica TaxID=39947 RepID=A0A0P0Y9V0_ORYSJ|nr:Os12g0453800 [Oryza sativa Japonica Group]